MTAAAGVDGRRVAERGQQPVAAMCRPVAPTDVRA